MAVTQTTDDRKSIVLNAQTDSDGYYYILFGPVRLYFGSGTPNGVITAPKGSLYIDRGNAKIYQNSDASTTWGAKT